MSAHDDAPLEPHEQRRAAVQNLPLLLSVIAGLCWAVALLLLQLGNLRAEAGLFAPQRLLFYITVLAASLLTFAPVEQRMGLRGLTIQGVGGVALLMYALAFVPPPTSWLLALPDLPVYLLLLTALFWTTSAAVMPFLFAASRRLFQQRARQLDLRRVRRQSYEVGFLVAAMAALAGLRVLTWVSILLLGLIVVLAELLFLSRISAEGT